MVDGISNYGSSLFSNADKSILGKDDFMKLMIQQLRYQDPMNPMENQEFASQLAQFTSLEQLSNLNQAVTESINANYVLTQSINNTLSANLIGKKVKLDGGVLNHSGNESIEIGYSLPANAQSVNVIFYDLSGNEVKRIENVPQTMGEHKLSWDFTDNNGNELPDGKYTFKVEAKDAVTGEDMFVNVFKMGVIDAIRFTNDGTKIVIDGNEYLLSDVLEIVNSVSPSNNGGGR